MSEVKVVTNLPDFKRQVREFGYDMERKIFRNGVAAATRVFRNGVQRVLSRPRVSPIRKGEHVGTLRRAIYMKRARDSKQGLEHYFVGVRQGKGERLRKGGSADAFYWKFVELGHRIVGRFAGKYTDYPLRGLGRKTGRALRRRQSTTAVPAYPFLQPAFQIEQLNALKKFNENVQARIDKENTKR
jgi:hypothetical protein